MPRFIAIQLFMTLSLSTLWDKTKILGPISRRWIPFSTVCILLIVAGNTFAMSRPADGTADNSLASSSAKNKAVIEPVIETAIFAGGCFWCMEKPFDQLDGVQATISGYINGHVKNPTYKHVSTGKSGHYEVVKVTYDATKVSYEELLSVFWVNIDPLDPKGQFCDKGPQYLSAIFAVNKKQKALALASKKALEASNTLNGKIVTPILDAEKFYPAEDYHQDYYRKNPWRYAYYRKGCGRDKRLEALWGEKR